MGDAVAISRYPGERELIVLASAVQLWGPSEPQAAPASVSMRALGAEMVVHATVASILKTYGASIQPLFAADPRERGGNRGLAEAPGPPAPARLYHRVVADDGHLDDIAQALRGVELVEAAYVKPRAEPAINRMQATAPARAAAGSPDFSTRQDYLMAAPSGVDAHYAWTQAGGKGAGVNIVDVEGAWRLTHEDLLTNKRGLLGGTQSNDIGWRNHGTAVLGVFSASENSFGVTGICPDAKVGMVAVFGTARTTSAAIREAADKLSPGDILLIELHRPGPRNAFQNRDDQNGYIAVEWWPDDFDAIQYAVGRGIIVVEAAGNGAQDLDDTLYETPDVGFPNDWKNPFRRTNRDSGAVLVGAGAPPPNTHGKDYGPDRSRLDFSNYGSAVDAQGWGREVTTSGYGDLQGGANEDHWYTDQFSGTSSASPVVVGALGCIQGVRHAEQSTLLTPQTARHLLRATGPPQQDAPGRPKTQRIGNRPDLRAMLAAPVTS
jgi:hypothetical protein